MYNSNINLELNETLMASETGELFNDLPDGRTRIESVQPVKGPTRVLMPNRLQIELRPSELESLPPEGHRARIVWGYVERQETMTRAATAREARIEHALARRPERAAIKKRQGKRPEDARASMTDADATVMKMGDGGLRPAYNVQ